MFGKKGKVAIMELIVAAAAIVLIIAVVKPGAFGQASAGGGVGGGTQTINVQNTAPSSSTTSLTIGPTENIFVPSTKTTECWHQVYNNGADMGLIIDGTVKTYAPFDKIKIYYCLNASDAYTSEGNEVTIPDKGSERSVTLDGDGKIYKNATPTISWKNSDDQIGDTLVSGRVTTSYNQTASAGDSKTIKIKLSGVNNYAFSPRVPVLVAVDYNKTTFSDVVSDMPAGTPIIQHGAPNSDYTTAYFLMAGAAGKGIIDNEVVEKAITFTTDNTYGGVAGEVVITWYDGDNYLDQYGAVKFGYEADKIGCTGCRSSTSRDVGTNNPTLDVYFE